MCKRCSDIVEDDIVADHAVNIRKAISTVPTSREKVREVDDTILVGRIVLDCGVLAYRWHVRSVVQWRF